MDEINRIKEKLKLLEGNIYLLLDENKRLKMENEKIKLKNAVIEKHNKISKNVLQRHNAYEKEKKIIIQKIARMLKELEGV